MDRDLWRLASVVVLGTIMSILDTTIVNVAIETLGRDLDASLNSIQWVSTGYLLALATVIPLTGWAMERFGGKRMWMLSVTLFLCGSTLCGLAWSTTSLIVFRVLQGFGGGMILPIGQAILAQAAGPQRMGRVMSVIGVPTLLGPILGPVIGGLIVDNFSWRWIFFVNLPVGVVALALAARILPRRRARRRARRWTSSACCCSRPAWRCWSTGCPSSGTRGRAGDDGASSAWSAARCCWSRSCCTRAATTR